MGVRRDAIRLEARTQEVRTAQPQVERSQAETEMMRAENRALQERLRDLKARPGPRGMVLTLEDLLFNSDEAELRPAGQRAAMVGEVLHGAGIASERMSMRGVGEGKPAASKQSAEGRAMKRRVEMVLSEALGPLRGR